MIKERTLIARMSQLLVFGSIVIIVMSLFSCGSKKSFQPVNLVKDDRCSYCDMSIKRDAFASEIVAEDGKVYRFDDFKCLEAFMQKSGSPRPAAIFVKDYDTRVWIPYDRATIVRTGIATPNRSGKVAFKDSVRAREFAAKNPPM